MAATREHHTVPLSVLLKRELASEKVEKPEILYGQACQSKKGEDFTLLKTECQRIVGDGITTYSVFGVISLWLNFLCHFNGFMISWIEINYFFDICMFYLISAGFLNTTNLVFFVLFFQLFDGHNGSAAAIYTKENLLNNFIAAMPPDLNRDEWVAALPRALVAGFVKTDKDFQQRGTTCFFWKSNFSWKLEEYLCYVGV